jgi:Ca-activated chloride channel family protein
MMRILFSLLLLAVCTEAGAQDKKQVANVRPELRKGNELYKEKKYQEAQKAYTSALQKDPASFTGAFNLGDALYKDRKFEPARQAMDAGIKLTKDKQQQARAYHNIGNSFMEEESWEEAAKAYKQALRLNPADPDTKYNLAYAYAMMKKEGGGDNKKDDKDNKDNKDNKDKKDDKDNKDKKDQDQNKDQGDKDKQDKDQGKDGQNPEDKKDKEEQEKPQPQPSKLSEQQAENLLNALRQEEKKLQDKKEKGKGVPVRLEKDW